MRGYGYGWCLAGAVLAITGAAQAAYLTNTNFETTPLGVDSAVNTFPGWTEAAGTAAVKAPTAISGSTSAKLVYVNAGNLLQNVTDPGAQLAQWTFETDFAASDPGSSTNRSFNLNLRHTATGFNQINLRIVQGAGAGTVQLYNGTSWTAIALPNAVTFSSSDTSLQVNHLKIVGDYSKATPSYDLFVTNALGATQSLTGLTAFQGTVPTSGTTLKVVSFETGNYPTSGSAFAVVDNVSVVPEPAALGLLGLGGLLALRRRRR